MTIMKFLTLPVVHCIASSKGPFNNYVDKMRGEESKNVCFFHPQGIKNVHAVSKVWQNSVRAVVE